MTDNHNFLKCLLTTTCSKQKIIVLLHSELLHGTSRAATMWKTWIDNKYYKLSKMPKLKTKSGAKKRFKLTGTGKIKRKNAYKSHILTKKETKQKRNLTQTSYVATVDEKSVLRQLAIK